MGTPPRYENAQGFLDMDLKITKETEEFPTGMNVEIRFLDGAENILKSNISVSEEIHFFEKIEGTVKLWDFRNPYLYQLEIRILDENGNVVEIVPYPIGFRKIVLEDGIMKLNGERLILNGVNRHEWNARSGRCIRKEDEIYDIACMKRNHINAVRTCHYPDRMSWYFRCDEAGIYVMAETNLESHGSWQKMGEVEPSWNVPGSVNLWRNAVLDRARTNFEVFKNHTSVLFWSLGNESYAGDVLQDMNAYYKEKDSDRLVHYEGVFQNELYKDSISDMESQMYATPQSVREYLENDPKKPFILCEYMHDMGNFLGE